MVRVSVVVPTYNNAKYIAAALDSVSGQTERDLEAVVVDDGSTDATLAIATAAAARDPRIRICAQPHSGKPSVVRNAGLRHTRGEHVAFLDGDDLYHPEKLAAGLRVLDEEPDIDLVFHDVRNVEEDGGQYRASRQEIVGFRENVLGRCESIGPELFVCDKRRLLAFMSTTSTCLCTSSVLIRRKALEAEERMFPEDVTIGEDVDLWFRLVEARTPAYVDRVLSYYRQHPDSLTTRRPDTRVHDLVAVHMRSYRRVRDALDRRQRVAYARRIAHDLFDLGYLYSRKGQPDNARRHYLAALAWHRGARFVSRSLAAIVKSYVARAMGRPRRP